MPNIIDTTYFQEQLAVAQKSDAAVSLSLTNMISYHEEDFLIKLLGYQLRTALGNTGSRYDDIKNGKEYTYGSQVKKWNGLAFTQGGIKKSPIANYVYCLWLEKEVSATTGSGEKKISSKIAVDYNPGQKICRTWNEMVHWNRSLVEFLQVNYVDYPEWSIYYSDSNLFETRNMLF